MAKAELVVATTTVLVVATFLWMAKPGFMGGPRADWLAIAATASGIAGLVIGLAWMVRIYRASPEPDQRAWRYRARD